MNERIPFNRVHVTGKEVQYMEDAISKQVSGGGEYTAKCQSLMEERFGASRVMLTTSCTAALEMAAILLNIEPGDEVIMPSYTFVSTSNAFVLRGARPVFVDIRRDTLNIDETLIEEKITDNTKAIVVVHYAGVPCEMNVILQIANDHGIPVVEDAAQAVNCFYEGQALGTLGTLGCYSFHETKDYSCGEGGALVVNDESLVERAEIVRDKGTDRSKFLRGEVDKYTWVDIGSSFAPSDMLAAFLYAQIENMDEIRQRRTELFDSYMSRLRPMADQGRIALPEVPNHHMFYVLCGTNRLRDTLLMLLKSKGISAVTHYEPLHESGYYLCHKLPLPVTEDVSARILRLPFYFDLSEDDFNEVVEAICGWGA